MTFQEKIDKVLKTNKLGIDSPSGLEAFIRVSVGTITKPLKKGKEPGLGTIKILLEKLGINEEWWETGKGEIYKYQPPSIDKMSGPEKEFIEANTDYWLVPKTVLEDKYRVVEVSVLDTQKRTIEALLEELTESRKYRTNAEAKISRLESIAFKVKGAQ